VRVSETASVTATDSGLAPGTRYYYRVRGVNDEGREGVSSAVRYVSTALAGAG
jgi:predicted phage tail protein